MKAIVKIGIIPVFAIAILGFTGFSSENIQGKGHGQQSHGGGGNGNGGGNENKQQGGGSSHGNGGGKDHGTSGHSQGGGNSQSHGNGNGGGKAQGKGHPQENSHDNKGNSNNGNASNGNSGNGEHGNGNKPNHGNEGHGNNGRGNSVAGKAEHGNMHGNQGQSGNVAKNRNSKGKHQQERIEGWDGNIDWGFNNYPDRRRPGNGKKVTICHRTSGEYPVEISVSEHAVQAHMNHGDNMGGCNVNYSDAWTPNYIEARQNVYNTYEQTWETMSYSEALLRYAAEKLLGIRSNLDQYRPTLSSQEIQHREALIYELQNNINALEAQRATTSQQLSGINININL